MNKKELRSLIVKENTIAVARKQVQQQVRIWGYDNTEIYVRCFSACDDNFTTDLYVELTDGNDWKTITLASITISEEDAQGDFYKFEELTWDIFKTMKKNMLKELKEYNYTITDTTDYHC
ncbi:MULTISPECIES: hypothetical protein [Clostridia]|uniref:hypothetical protein n=1 Tax=Clostridia TaxID=186801 RepID=UPI002A858B7B|nr:hypothetical protein [Peptostreptococcus porci]MDY5098769.1 hypothetical protein [Clostridium sp.]MDY5437434.1 hypothetical protein [Peptostreptococcus porci]